MSDNRSIVYYDTKVGAWVYRASSVGRSLRCLSSARQGYDPLPPPDYLVAAAEAGNRYELIVKAKMRGQGYKISGEQGAIDYEIREGLIIRGHLDAQHCIAPLEPLDRMLEVKSMSKRVFDKWLLHGFEGFPEYAAQVTMYMHAEGQRRNQGTVPECVYAVINRDTDEMEIRILREPPTRLQSIIQKVALSEQFADMHQLPVCDSGSQYSCPFDYLCDRHEILFEEIEDGKEATMIHLGQNYVEILKQENVVKDNKETLRNEIRTAMGKREKLVVPGFTFSNKKGKPKRTLNLIRLRERLGDDLDTFFDDKPAENPTLRVTPKKEKK